RHIHCTRTPGCDGRPAPPPHPAVLPYTTLFPSEHGIATTSGTTALHRVVAATGLGPGDEIIMPAFTIAATAFAALYVDEGGHDEDRKSTRLNSSHVAISYAVFCLKKRTYSK